MTVTTTRTRDDAPTIPLRTILRSDTLATFVGAHKSAYGALELELPTDAPDILAALWTDRGGSLRMRKTLDARTIERTGADYSAVALYRARLAFHSGRNVSLYASVMHGMGPARARLEELETLALVTLALGGQTHSVGAERWARALGIK